MPSADYSINASSSDLEQGARLMLTTIVKQAPQLAMGSFREGMLETNELILRFISFPGGTIVLYSRPDARDELVEQKIGELIGKVSS